jgi:hypothetical protein
MTLCYYYYVLAQFLIHEFSLEFQLAFVISAQLHKLNDVIVYLLLLIPYQAIIVIIFFLVSDDLIQQFAYKLYFPIFTLKKFFFFFFH